MVDPEQAQFERSQFLPQLIVNVPRQAALFFVAVFCNLSGQCQQVFR